MGLTAYIQHFSWTWPCINTMLLVSILSLLAVMSIKVLRFARKVEDKVNNIDIKFSKAQIEFVEKLIDRLGAREKK